MAEGQLHRDLCNFGAKWLFDNGCEVWTKEACVAGWGNGLPFRPDIFGILTRPTDVLPFPKWTSIEIEAEPDLRGIRVEMKKRHRGKDSLNWSVGQIQYLLFPDTLEPDRDTFKIPKHMGGLYCSEAGVVTPCWPPGAAVGVDHHAEKAILASLVMALQRETGKQATEVRSGYGARLSANDTVNLIAHLKEHPHDPLKAAARDCRIDIKKLRKAAKAGIPGVIYTSTPPGTLVLETAHQASSIRECLDRVYEAGGKAWDDVPDPDAAIREMRGE